MVRSNSDRNLAKKERTEKSSFWAGSPPEFGFWLFLSISFIHVRAFFFFFSGCLLEVLIHNKNHDYRTLPQPPAQSERDEIDPSFAIAAGTRLWVSSTPTELAAPTLSPRAAVLPHQISHKGFLRSSIQVNVVLTGFSPSFSTLLTSATQGSCVPIYGRWGTPARLLASLPPLRIVPLRISAKPYDPTGNGNPGSRFPLLKPKEKKIHH